ncbi:MAG: 50S ribosomal protein L9 [Lachnospiraceae bacterium]|nr:50S ribosomal protein L9 [Lachnospiraceae bacterium]
MKVVLLQDVKTLGKKDAIVTVNDGYARNYLIPRKLAVEATQANLNTLKAQVAAAQRQAEEELVRAKIKAAEMEKVRITIPMKVGAGGKLFGAVSSKEIADAVKAQWGIDVDKKKVQLAEPIKAVGEETVEIKLHREVTAKITVAVVEA